MKTTAKCSCGRPQSDAHFVIQRSIDRRFTYYRCECGREWTITEAIDNVLEPVTANEVIEVHERLAKFEGSFRELLGLPE